MVGGGARMFSNINATISAGRFMVMIIVSESS